jgi:hypothetical protein
MRRWLWGVLLLGLSPLAFAQSDQCVSKLSIHLIGNYTEGAKRIIAAKPTVIKVLDPQASAGMREAMRDYKRRHPKGLVVVRVWERTSGLRYRLEDDPVQSADDFWNRVLRPAMDALSASDRRLVDFLEGPNECENTPCWESMEGARWFGRFWERLADRIAQAGFRPCVGSIPVGNPAATLVKSAPSSRRSFPHCVQRSGSTGRGATTHTLSTTPLTPAWSTGSACGTESFMNICASDIATWRTCR